MNRQNGKNKIYHRILPVSLAFCMTFGMVQMSASAKEPAEELQVQVETEENTQVLKNQVCGYYVYSLEDGKATITGYTNNPGGEKLVIPDSLDGYPVVAIGESAFWDYNYDFKELVIPASVERLEDGAIGCNSYLETVIFEGNGLKTIGKCTFSGCYNMKEINLPNSLEEIDSFAFDSCRALVKLTVPYGVKKLGNSVFINCNNLATVELPSTITAIGFDLFFSGNQNATVYAPLNSYAYNYAIEKNINVQPLVEKINLTIKKQPVDVTLAEGEKAYFTVEAIGNQLQYQWIYSMDNGVTWKRPTSASAQTNSFALTAAMKWNGMILKCKITDENNTMIATNPVRYTVLEAPVIVSQPASITGPAGLKADFSVEATGDGLTYQWYYITATGTTWKKCSSDKALTDSYSITAADKWNGARFFCAVYNEKGVRVKSKVATLTVLPAATITKQPTDVTVKIGEKAKYSVEAQGEGLTYQWYYTLDGGTTWKKATSTSATTPNFSITAAEKWRGMKLKCVIYNADGAKASSNVVNVMIQ